VCQSAKIAVIAEPTVLRACRKGISVGAVIMLQAKERKVRLIVIYPALAIRRRFAVGMEW
jgi:hypothetical protein